MIFPEVIYNYLLRAQRIIYVFFFYITAPKMSSGYTHLWIWVFFITFLMLKHVIKYSLTFLNLIFKFECSWNIVYFGSFSELKALIPWQRHCKNALFCPSPCCLRNRLRRSQLVLLPSDPLAKKLQSTEESFFWQCLILEFWTSLTFILYN